MIGTTKYEVAKFINSISKTSIRDSYMLHSTDHFLHLPNQGIFLFKDKLYETHNSASMGFPLAKTLEKFFSTHIKIS